MRVHFKSNDIELRKVNATPKQVLEAIESANKTHTDTLAQKLSKSIKQGLKERKQRTNNLDKFLNNRKK